VWRPPFTSHCIVCNHCVTKLDHHCVFVNNCLGPRNLFSAVMASNYGFVISLTYLIVYYFYLDCKHNLIRIHLYIDIVNISKADEDYKLFIIYGYLFVLSCIPLSIICAPISIVGVGVYFYSAYL
jgi:hypothetical protein